MAPAERSSSAPHLPTKEGLADFLDSSTTKIFRTKKGRVLTCQTHLMNRFATRRSPSSNPAEGGSAAVCKMCRAGLGTISRLATADVAVATGAGQRCLCSLA